MPFDGIVTKAVVDELKDTITPGKINKIYQPTETEIVLTIRSKGKNQTLLISIHPTYSRLHLTNDQYQNPKEPPMFCMVLRKHLVGATIESIVQHNMERVITFHVKTRNEIGDETTKKLVIELMGKHSNVLLVDEDKGHIMDSLKHVPMAQNRYRTILPGAPYVTPPNQNKLNPLEIDGETFIRKLDFNAGKLDRQIVDLIEGVSPFIAREIVNQAKLGTQAVYQSKFLEFQSQLSNKEYSPCIYKEKKEDFHVLPITTFGNEKIEFASVNDMLDQFYSGKAERDRVKQQAKDLYRLIKNEKDKNERKLKKHQKTLQKAENADYYQKMGELLTAHMHLVQQGDTVVQVIDYYDPEQKSIEIELNPNKSPSENAQNYFKTYQKLKTSKQMVEQEITKTKEEIQYLEQLLQQIDSANVEDVEEIREELREEGYIKRQSKQKKKKKPSTPKPEQYVSTDGTLIFVGKNNKQNEYVTMKLARRDEIWLHTKDIPGSHVLIRNTDPSEQTLLEAAQLAAYFSKSGQSSSVPVDYTKIRHVKKPNGAKPGFVTYENQKTIFVTPEKDVVDQLRK